MFECLEDRSSPDTQVTGLDRELIDELSEVSSALHAMEATVRLEHLAVIARLDDPSVWRPDGQTSMGSWLCLHLGVSRKVAGEMVSVSRAVGSLPALADAYRGGRLSWEHLVVGCELADPSTDAAWAEEAPCHTPEALRRMLAAQRVSDRDAADVHARRGFSFRRDRSGCGTRLSGLLADEVAAAVKVELDRIREHTAVIDPDTGLRPRVDQQRADALGVLVGLGLAADGDLDRATVVVHFDTALLDPSVTDAAHPAGSAGWAVLPDGTPIAPEPLRRLACDCRIELHADNPEGVTLGVGRATRNWPAWMTRIIRRRDAETCRFPGCARPIHHIHHMHHWTNGGRTDTDNGVGLCYTHHHAVHEAGWRALGDANREVVFVSPDGLRRHRSRPPGIRPCVEARVSDEVDELLGLLTAAVPAAG